MTAENATADPTTGPEDRRWLALYVLCGGLLMIVLDATIVNVALPTIKDDLGFSQSNLAWVVNAYLIAFGGLLLLAGRLGDLIGQRRIFLIGLTVFTSASLLCALSQSQAMLIAARFVQGAGGAIGSAVILGMIVIMFPEPREQAKAIGVFSFIASAGASIGLLAGGVITEAISWHWIFAVNVPIGIAIALLARRLVSDREGIGLDKGADVPGAALLTGGLMLGVYTLLEAGEKGWGSLHTIGLGGLAVCLLAAFSRPPGADREPADAAAPVPLPQRRRRQPVMGLLVVGFFGMFFLGALYMQEHPRLLPAWRRLRIPALLLGDGNALARLRGEADHRDRRPHGADRRAGPLPGIGLLLFARTPVDGNYLTDLFPVMLLLGAGAGTCFPAMMTLAMSGATQSDAGLASGPRQHDHPGRRRDRARRSGDGRRGAHRRPRGHRVARRGPQLRLPPRVPDRRRLRSRPRSRSRWSSFASPTSSRLVRRRRSVSPAAPASGRPSRPNPKSPEGLDQTCLSASAQRKMAMARRRRLL